MKIRYFALLASLLVQPSFATRADDGVDNTTSEADFGNTVANTELDENRGTFMPIVINTSNLNANLSGNSVTGGNTGNNNISNGAFNGLNGFATVIQNSGNNVIIQDSTQINVFFDSQPVAP